MKKIFRRPVANVELFEGALELADLSTSQQELIDYIRFIGTFTQPILNRELGLTNKPPALSILCDACRKIGMHMPEHFSQVRSWSVKTSQDGVQWDGDLVCSITWNIDGTRLCPEEGTAQFHNFAVHPELFNGL